MNRKYDIFISHQKKDKEEAKKIADYLKSVGFKVYFDEYDKDLQIATRARNAKGVVGAIEKGIQNSMYMLCLVSRNTLSSEWVPFEIGYGYDKTDLFTLTLKGIDNSELPDYIKVTTLIRNIDDLNSFIGEKGKKSLLESKGFIKKDSTHPLRNIMDF